MTYQNIGEGQSEIHEQTLQKRISVEGKQVVVPGLYEQKQVVNQPYEQKEVRPAHELNLPFLNESHPKLGNDNQVSPVFGRILGWGRANFWRLAIAVVIIIAIVGGAVGGTLARRTQGKSENGNTPSNITLPRSGNNNSTSGTTIPKQPTTNLTIQGVAATSFLGSDGEENIRVYYQTDSATGIFLRSFHQYGSFSQPTYLSLSIEPKNGSPLAAIAIIDTGGNLVENIFYLNTDNAIVNAATNCTPPYDSCLTPTNEIISNQVAPQGVNPSSSLAAFAISLEGHRVLRVFFQDGGNRINQLTSESNWTSIYVMDPVTAPGSFLAASFTQLVDMDIFYESSPSVLGSVAYAYSTNWAPAPNITNATSLSTTASIAAVANFPPWIRRTYYIGNDKNIYETNNAAGNWSQAAKASLPSADSARSQLAAVAIASQTRIYYQVNSSLLEAQINGSSTDPSNILGWSLIL